MLQPTEPLPRLLRCLLLSKPMLLLGYGAWCSIARTWQMGRAAAAPPHSGIAAGGLHTCMFASGNPLFGDAAS